MLCTQTFLKKKYFNDMEANNNSERFVATAEKILR